MCTVTFIPFEHTIYITHNRDEKVMRKAARPPKLYHVHSNWLLFPKDGEAGGSWIGVNQNGHAGVLLNGAFHKHIPASCYRKSRGLVFLEILSSANIHHGYYDCDLTDIEPFTVILWDGKQLAEYRWDGNKKYTRELSPKKPHIWSSSTLYDESVAASRNSWFEEWLTDHPSPSPEDILKFHSEGGEGDLHNDLRINRDDLLVTLSTTCIEMTNEKAVMKYIDLADDSVHMQELLFLKAPVNSR